MFECFNEVYTIFNDKSKSYDTVQHLLQSTKFNKDYLEVEKISDNPFTLYGAYLDMLRKPITEKSVEHDIHIEEIAKLNAEIEMLKAERDASLQVTDVFLDMEQEYKADLVSKVTENFMLSKKIEKETKDLNSKLNKVKFESLSQLEKQKTAANNFRIMVMKEIDCLKSIIKISVKERKVAL